MIDLWYCNIDLITNDWFFKTISMYPEFIKRDILKYKSIQDQKSRLLGRELVRKYLLDKALNTSISQWKLDLNKKPYIDNGPYFNITHSGKFVAVVFSDDEVGIDLEEEKNIDVSNISNFFHPEEKIYLKNRNYDLTIFYEIWVKKEAFLKATGIGIIKGLNNENVLEKLLFKEKKWYFYEFNLSSGYHGVICSKKTTGIKEIIEITFTN